jgi:hypothetical protein
MTTDTVPAASFETEPDGGGTVAKVGWVELA